jgi:hypothetical protein
VSTEIDEDVLSWLGGNLSGMRENGDVTRKGRSLVLKEIVGSADKEIELTENIGVLENLLGDVDLRVVKCRSNRVESRSRGE